MPIYRVLQSYEANITWKGVHEDYGTPKHLGPWREGDRVELETELAAWVNRDAPCTVEIDEKP
jgi:hypothetical protein